MLSRDWFHDLCQGEQTQEFERVFEEVVYEDLNEEQDRDLTCSARYMAV